MIEILSLVFGGALRLIPSVLDYFDAKNKRQHEREMAALEMEKMKIGSELRQQEKELDALKDASVEQTKARFCATGNWFVDMMLAFVELVNSTVRPVLTYWYCVLGVGLYKFAAYQIMLDQGASWKDAVTSLWGSVEWSIVLSIIGFWFVDRAIRKMKV
jgi:uncharacterized membrane protein YvlD (DUF360 family)